MHIFGTTCFCSVQNKAKLDPCCEKGMFVGYHKQSPAYLIFFQNQQLLKELGM